MPVTCRFCATPPPEAAAPPWKAKSCKFGNTAAAAVADVLCLACAAVVVVAVFVRTSAERVPAPAPARLTDRGPRPAFRPDWPSVRAPGLWCCCCCCWAFAWRVQTLRNWWPYASYYCASGGVDECECGKWKMGVVSDCIVGEQGRVASRLERVKDLRGYLRRRDPYLFVVYAFDRDEFGDTCASRAGVGAVGHD